MGEAIMSTPLRNEDEDPRLYAPHWARRSPSVLAEPSTFTDATLTSPAAAGAPASTAGTVNAAAAAAAASRITAHPSRTALGAVSAPPMAPGIGGPNIGLPPQRLRPFEGDVAVKDLRRRLSLDPDLVPQPPYREGSSSGVPWFGRLLFVLVTAAMIAVGVTLITLPSETRKDAGTLARVITPLLENAPGGNTPGGNASGGNASGGNASLQPTRLVVESHKGFANEPIPLGVSLNAGSGAEILTLVGLANGTKLSAGTPLGLTGWQMSAREVGNVMAYAPRDFVGVMDAAIDLRSPRDRLMDSQFVRLEWMPKKESRLTPAATPPRPDQPSPAAPTIHLIDPEELATLMKRGEDFLKNGDIASARLILRRAANAGHAQAALALGVTFDPRFLAEQGVLGFAPDVAQARAWYERAAELGSSEAARRLERLPGRGR
jgi:hypothetical protein